MSIITAFLNSLVGKKTYLAAAGFVALALFQALSPLHDYAGAGQSLLAALTAVGLRSAVATETNKALVATQDAVAVASTTAANVATYAARAQK